MAFVFCLHAAGIAFENQPLDPAASSTVIQKIIYVFVFSMKYFWFLPFGLT
jgi:hypothetical protein